MTSSIASRNSEVSEILQKLIRRDDITVAELARRVNLPQPTIQRIASGVYKHPRSITLQPIAKYFGVTINQLRGFEPIISSLASKKVIKSIPLISITQLNSWPFIEKDFSQYVVCDNNLGENSFAMYMPDNSMEPVIPKGSILLIDPSRIPHHGSYVLVKIQNFPEVVIRELITDATKRFIKPLSPELSYLEMSSLTDNDLIKGVVIEIRLCCEY